MNGSRIQITGVVQGVGFRPFVYNAAYKLGIKGTIKNDAAGVDIHAAGDKLEAFIRIVTEETPPLARIENIEITAVEIAAEDFTIIASQGGGSRQVDIAADTRTCDDCLAEFHDPDDRRYRYPFINCTNCGPRYTIIKDVPYDRPFTSMAAFPMCPDCQAEYDDPGNRRFHAQPNCCPVCGPHYNDIDEGIRVLREGGILAIKGIGGFHLACDAHNLESVARLRQLKDRDRKPFALMAARADLLDLTANEKALIEGLERPIMLIDKERAPDIAPDIAPGLNSLGIMLPYAPIHYRLFEEGGFDLLVMTSGNRKGAPMVIDQPETLLGDIADYILDHNRGIIVRNDDSVLRELAGEPVFLRRSRGYAPAPIRLNRNIDGLLAVGAMLKNAIALGRGEQAYLSQYIGDLENEAVYESLEFTCNHLQRMYAIEPSHVICDLHPHYLSTTFAESLDLPIIRVQHHEAHARACLAENRIDRAISVVYDGVGYGDDGHAWGGEIFSIDGKEIIREAHLDYMPMAGGDACVAHPLRLAAGILIKRGIELPDMDPVYEMLEKDINIAMTSGMGRLFDAAAAITGICTHQFYEGQGPMELESISAPLEGAGHYEADGLDPGSILEQLFRDTASADIRSARFHNTIIALTVKEIVAIAQRTGQERVCFSGGCFQNVLLLEGMLAGCQPHLEVFRHRLVPPNDGCIALGQLAAASWH